MGNFLWERLAGTLVNPDFALKGPFGIVAIEELETDSSPGQNAFQEFTQTVDNLAEKCGCHSTIKFKRVVFCPDDHSGMQGNLLMVQQIVVFPGTNQSIWDFEQSLKKMSLALTEADNIKDSVKLAELALQFSHRIQKSISSQEHGQYLF
ncbi:MAG: hypothetical protein NTZ93_01650 [Candidatus Beckwithbacteria bacterium]|nr:hypothetical protein [Candidatus Beckwithbacteria bacterium]